MRYFESRPYAMGYNGRTGLSGENWFTSWALPAIKKYGVPLIKKHALPALKRHGLATVANTVKNLSKDQPMFDAVKNALGKQVKTAFSKKPIKAAKKQTRPVSRRRTIKATRRVVKRKAKKSKSAKAVGFKELVL